MNIKVMNENQKQTKLDKAMLTICNSNYIFLFIFLIVCICWVSNALWQVFLILSLIAFIILATQKNLIYVMPVLCSYLFSISKGANSDNLDGTLPYILAFIPLILGFVVNSIRFLPKMKKGKLFYPTLAVSISFAVGGMFARMNPEGTEYFGATYAVPILIFIGIALFAMYFYFSSTVNNTIKINAFDYMCRVVVMIAFIVMFHMSYTFIKAYLLNDLNSYVGFKRIWSFGWGISNNAGSVLSLAMPLTLYFAYKGGYKTVLFTVLAFVEYGFILMSCSRGASLFSSIFLIPLIVYFLYTSKHKKEFVTALFVLLTGLTILVAFFWDIALDILEEMIKKGLGDAGRLDLYAEGMDAFFRHPLFGVGFDYKFGFHIGDTMPTTLRAYFFHCTVVQVLASAGIVGGLSFLWFYYERIKILFRKGVEYKMMLFAFLIFEGYAMVDTNNFNPNQLILLVMLFISLEKLIEQENKNKIDNAQENFLTNNESTDKLEGKG